MSIIYPRQGIGPVRFGFTPEQVAEVAGPPRQRLESWDGSVAEDRGPNMPTYSFREGCLWGIGAAPGCGVLTINGIDVFAVPPQAMLRHLAALNGGALRFGLGTFVFDGLALTAGDFFDAEEQAFVDLAGGSDPRGITWHREPQPEWDIATFPAVALESFVGS